LLISSFVYTFPEILNKDGWLWKESILLPIEKKPLSFSGIKTKEKRLNMTSTKKTIFPDLVIIKKQKITPTKNIKQSVPKSRHTLRKILTQVEKFPERLNVKISSKKQLSAPVVSLLSLLPQKNMREQINWDGPFIRINEKNRMNSSGSNELKNYLNEMSKFLSERWEVPIHLKESQVTVAIMFEINKNGEILNWELEESGSPALQNSVNNLMKSFQFLPALPNSYPENSYIFGVRFSPTIIQK